jgi:hypothetical protein
MLLLIDRQGTRTTFPVFLLVSSPRHVQYFTSNLCYGLPRTQGCTWAPTCVVADPHSKFSLVFSPVISSRATLLSPAQGTTNHLTNLGHAAQVVLQANLGTSQGYSQSMESVGINEHVPLSSVLSIPSIFTQQSVTSQLRTI